VWLSQRRRRRLDERLADNSMKVPWLKPKQLESLTGRKKPSAQMRVLRESDPPIPFTVVNGKPIVMVSDLCKKEADSFAPQLVLPLAKKRKGLKVTEALRPRDWKG